MKYFPYLILLLIGSVLFSFTYLSKESTKPPAEVTTDRNDFDAYWFSGEAELTRYELSQARYGEAHQGEAVFIL